VNLADLITQSQKIFHEQNAEIVSRNVFFIVEFARYYPAAPIPLAPGQ
jgi:hypothetical protein